ncbi:MAG: FkbM family methyltransferase [Ilumatobacteraceae bacterium]
MGRQLASGTIEYDGFVIHFDPTEPGEAESLLTNGSYESDTVGAIKAILRDGSTFVDGGAHIGLLTCIAARCVGRTGSVIAFEPAPRSRNLLEANVAANSFEARVTVVDAAISDHVGSGELMLVEGASQANSLRQPGDDGAHRTVEIVSLDHYFESLGWPAVDLVKLDVEGQELRAILGMQELVRRNPQLQLIFEYHQAQLQRSRTDPAELFSALQQMGFDSFTSLFRQPKEFAVPADLAWLDQLASRANINVLAARRRGVAI